MGIRERKEREKGARKEEILNAAEKIFFEKGLATSTMDDIAEGAELSKGTLYLYYKSKEDIYLSVALRGTEIMYSLFQKALSTDEPIIKLIANLGEAYYDYFKNYRDYFRMFYFFETPQLHTQVSPELMQLCHEGDLKIWDLVIGLIQRGIDEGILHQGLNPKEAAVMLWSNSNGFMRLMDRSEHYWQNQFGIDLESTLRKSNAFLVEAMMSEKGYREFGHWLPHHEEDQQR